MRCGEDAWRPHDVTPLTDIGRYLSAIRAAPTSTRAVGSRGPDPTVDGGEKVLDRYGVTGGRRSRSNMDESRWIRGSPSDGCRINEMIGRYGRGGVILIFVSGSVLSGKP